MIKLEDISVTFGKGTVLQNTALEDVNLNIAKGDFITVIGSNGAGKSTLLGVLSGNILPSHGNVLIDDINVTRDAIERRAKWIGYVHQDPRLGTCDTLSVEENLALAQCRGKKRGLKLAINRQKRHEFRSLLTELDTRLENKLCERVAMLSGGQRQILSLVMATLEPPKLLLLDEHTSALDPKSAKHILTLTKQIVSQNHLTAFMVTHNMNYALATGNRTLLMRQGKIIRDVSERERNILSPGDLIDIM